MWLAFTLAGTDLGEDGTREVPTMLFGLGAIGLVNEPRGVVYDIVNRQRLRQYKAKRSERTRSRSSPPTAPAGAPA